MSWLGSLFSGSSPTLNSLIPTYGSIGQTQTGQGQTNQNTASSFWDSIVSGDATKQMQALSPEISAAKVSNQQTQKTNTIFGNRGGGTAATNAASSDKLHSDITNLIGSLTNSSASSLASLGTNQVNTGLSSFGMQQQASQEQLSNWANSILGKGISGAINYAESFAPVPHGG
jgi:hypothetical protein